MRLMLLRKKLEAQNKMKKNGALIIVVAVVAGTSYDALVRKNETRPEMTSRPFRARAHARRTLSARSSSSLFGNYGKGNIII